MSMNDDIWADPVRFPAVTELDREHIERAAIRACLAIADEGWAWVNLQPSDGTVYLIAVIEGGAGDYLFASSMGPMAAWSGRDVMHPDYALSHYVTDPQGTWTATVFALFLNALGAELASRA